MLGHSAAEAATSRLLALDEPPTAIFAATPMAGQGVFAAMRAKGRQDIALLVFGDFPMAGLLTRRSRSSTRTPRGWPTWRWTGCFARIAGDDVPPCAVVRPTRLIVRGSAEVPPRPVTGGAS